MRRPILLTITRPKFYFNRYILLAMAAIPLISVITLLLSGTLRTTPLQPIIPIPKDAEYMPGQVVVKFKTSPQGQYLNQPEAYLAKNADISIYKDFQIQSVNGITSMQGTVVYQASTDADVKAMVAAFNANPAVEYAEPNYIVRAFKTPNDTFYKQGRQYYLDKVNLPAAWDTTTGSNQIVIAVVDTGVRNNHSLTLYGGNTDNDTLGAFVPDGIGGGEPKRSPNGPAAPLPTGVDSGDQCYKPQPAVYPQTMTTPTASSTNSTGGSPVPIGTIPAITGCTVSPLGGGAGVNDLKGRVYWQNGISTVPDCQPPRWNPQSPECNTDYNGHGTAVAGIIAANSNDGKGIAGVNWNANILPIRALDYSGAGAESWVADGITQAANLGARVINLSLGTTTKTQAMAEAIQYAQNKGCIIVAASGNAANGVSEYPAALPGVIAVGATDENNNVASFSSFGSWVSVVAPGSNILTTNLNWPGTEFGKGSNPFLYDPSSVSVQFPLGDRGDYTTVSGTSFSAPIVTGIIGLMLSVNPQLSAASAKAILEGTATDIDSPGRDDRTGYGLVNAQAAVQAASVNNITPNRNSLIQGLVTGATPTDVVMSLDPGQVVKNLDSSGQFRFDQMAAGQFTLRAIIPRAGKILGPVTINLTGASDNTVNVNFDFASSQIITGPGAFVSSGSSTSTSSVSNPQDSLATQSSYFNRINPVTIAGQYYFTETGHTLKGEFKKYWDSHGGLPVFGFPISEEFQEISRTDGKTYLVQYFERNRFEFHPDLLGTPYSVLLGLLGSEMTNGRTFAAATPVASTSTTAYFSQTSHTLSGRFKTYWDAHGGLAIFGYPISEPFSENGYLVQYFERNRFEYHPENANTQYDVLLGLLGNDLARDRNYLR